jgi:dephospho-CoA kinase
MLRIGLTGGIGSGKTTVAALFAGHGIPVIDTDEIARALAQPGQDAYVEIVRVFGAGILDTDRHIDRTQLGQLVFMDPAKRRQLEAILHPRIRAQVERQIQSLHAPYCIVVAPLLIEAGFADRTDRILVIDCDESQQLARVAARSTLNEAEIRRIMAAQLSRTERLQHADEVLENNGDLPRLEAEVRRLHARYLALAAARPS